MANPKMFTTPFAENGNRHEIPESVASEPQFATMREGFPPITKIPISEGGYPPDQADFNGILHLYGEHILHLMKGMEYEFDQEFAYLIGGYPVHSRLSLSDGRIVKNTLQNNTSNPNVDMDGWGYEDQISSENVILDDGGTQAELNSLILAKIASISGGYVGAYATIEDALTHKDEWPDNSTVMITNDGEYSGLYLWDGTDLIKSEYDPLQLSKEYTDKEVMDSTSKLERKIGKTNYDLSFKKSIMYDFYTNSDQISSIEIDDMGRIFPIIPDSIKKISLDFFTPITLGLSVLVINDLFQIVASKSSSNEAYILDFFTLKTIGISSIMVNEKSEIFSKPMIDNFLNYDFFTPQTIGVSVLMVNDKGQILSSGSGGGDSSLRVDLNEILTSQQKTENSPRFFRNGEQVMQRQNEYPDYYFQSYEELDCTSEGMYQKFDAIMADFPDLITRREIGRSVQDRPIYEYAVTPISWRTGATNPPEEKHIKPVTIAMYACVHGDEYAAVTGLYIWLQNLMRRWRELDWYGLHRYACQFRLVPCANPDGMTAKTNNNADNVNLNRNFASDWSSSAANAGPYAASEPETQALQAWFAETDASMFIDLHEGSTNELMWVGSWTDAGFGILNDAASRMVTFAFQNLDLASYVNADKTRMVYITKSVGGTAVNYLGNILQKNAILIESADRSHAMFRRNPQILREYSSKFISTIVECNRAKIQLNRSNGDFAH